MVKEFSAFERSILDTIQDIPRGKVATYAGIARRIGRLHAARAVGNALNKNPHLISTPCHRVVRTDGHIGGYVKGICAKKALLAKEGIVIHNNYIDLGKYSLGW